MTFHCNICSRSFVAIRTNAKYCGGVCRRKAERNARAAREAGASASDTLRLSPEGFEVYALRAVAGTLTAPLRIVATPALHAVAETYGDNLTWTPDAEDPAVWVLYNA